MKELNIRGLSCPQPVMLVKIAIDAGDKEIAVLADDPTAVENIKRLAENNGFDVEIIQQGGEFLARLFKS